jgi:GNAT superfamily N-acetyltransferase
MFRQKLPKLSAIYRQDGGGALVRHLGSALITSVCDYQIQEVRGRIIMAQDPVSSPRGKESDLATECVIVEPGDSLAPFAADFSQPFRDSFESLRLRLDQGCTLMLARRAQPEGIRREIVGYSIMELGAFSAAGIKGKISQDILFVHHTEVAEKYRGQRIAERISRARNDYCRRRGIKKACTAHSPDNTTSARAFRKFGSRILCYAVRVSLLRGLFVWHTPWKKIARAIAELDVDSARAGSKFEVESTRRFEVRG